MDDFTADQLVTFVEEEAGARAAAVCRDGCLDSKSFLLLSISTLDFNYSEDKKNDIYYALFLSQVTLKRIGQYLVTD